MIEERNYYCYPFVTLLWPLIATLIVTLLRHFCDPILWLLLWPFCDTYHYRYCYTYCDPIVTLLWHLLWPYCDLIMILIVTFIITFLVTLFVTLWTFFWRWKPQVDLNSASSEQFTPALWLSEWTDTTMYSCELQVYHNEPFILIACSSFTGWAQ